ncbi:hypothetical protein A5682_12400 [Mycobacterium mantenii]|uniref:hypothetical protein n=1 Tax=Mycobacterium mantenii TaxID=560555 RepID=UPI0008012488|nr:hypothetical protein [Mycobacterium mantenii]OBH67943.1 hypothetical protein A5682_12400 [Mycobacterium mantenii]
MGLRLPDGRPETKYQAWRLENGQDSLTRFLAAPGSTSLVCGADGVGHAARSWVDTRALFTPEQPLSLAADDQTRGYAEASVSPRGDTEAWHWMCALTAPVGTA